MAYRQEMSARMHTADRADRMKDKSLGQCASLFRSATAVLFFAQCVDPGPGANDTSKLLDGRAQCCPLQMSISIYTGLAEVMADNNPRCGHLVDIFSQKFAFVQSNFVFQTCCLSLVF